ncbi:MAG TPA: hypothetical protein VE783_05265 [Candidatus Limnocylindrales bacterium]|nr:hypothetical protein [Candidatus Limnocylindrales bacterium]
MTDVTLMGIAERISGSDDETGRATLKALATGEESIELMFPSGTRREVRSGAGATREGHWSAADGVWHSVQEHNLKAEGVWFSPTLLLSQALADKTKAFQHLGTSVIEGQSLEHIRAHHGSPVIPAKAPEQVARLTQHLTEVDLYLDPVSALPLKLTFNEHPDNDASRDIPVEIRFSDYRPVNGAQVPFRLQKFINGTLLLDIRVEQAILNSNLPASTFTVQ